MWLFWNNSKKNAIVESKSKDMGGGVKENLLAAKKNIWDCGRGYIFYQDN